MSTALADPPELQRHAPIPTWFHIGGLADAFARPTSHDQLADLLRRDPSLRILGDGANLLVHDEGVADTVVSLAAPAFSGWQIDARTGIVRAGAGANLPKLIHATIREGLAGLEVLGGVPASLGGALVMNAGGAFGQIADVVRSVTALARDGSTVHLSRQQIAFAYRSSGLEGLIITGCELALTPADPAPLRERLLDIMAKKKASQPLAAHSAGCVWKNPTLPHDHPSLGPAGTRVSAGMVIDRAGLKGLTVGGASISPVHANFVVTDTAIATAQHVIDLMIETRRRVFDTFGVTLHPEVVIWRRRSLGLDPEGVAP